MNMYRVYRKPDLGGLLPGREELKGAFRALSKPERNWIQQAVWRSEVPDEPELAWLVAGTAWVQLSAFAWGWTAFAVALVAGTLAAVVAGFPINMTLPLFPVLPLLVVQVFVARRLAGTIALCVARHGPRP